MESFIIRAATINDANAIVECHKESVEKRAAAFYDANIINEWSWTPDLVEKIRGKIKNRDFIFLVASGNNYILGYGVANPKTLEFKSLCTRPNKIGRVGASILAELLQHCKKQGCPYLDLSSSLNAEKFYLDRVLEKSQHILNSGLEMDCIKMRIELNPHEE